MKQITFNNGTEDVTLTIQNIFAYTYNATKNVLKISVSEADHTFEEIAELKKCTGKIVFTEDGSVKSEYTGYKTGDRGFICNYAGGVFDVEVERESALDIRIDIVDGLIEELNEVLLELVMA